jgi:hypothetical protein
MNNNREKINDVRRDIIRKRSRVQPLDSFLNASRENEKKLQEAKNQKVSLSDVKRELNNVYKKIQPVLIAISLRAASSSRWIFNRINKIWLFSGVVAAIVLLLGFTLISQSTKENSDDNPQVAGQATAAEPEFNVVRSPANNEESNIVKYDPEKRVASYEDTINGVRVAVSQQEVPADKKSDELFLVTVAQSFGLNEEISTDKGGVFIGSNENEQVTTVVFRFQDFLVFMRSSGLLTPEDIIEYVNSMTI